MGTSNSSAKICKVTPKEELSFHQAASPKIMTAMQCLAQHQETIGHRHRQLPPLKQHVPSPPDSQNLHAKPTHSIIKSHPPQSAKIWKPNKCPMEPPGASKTYNEHVSMRNKGGFLPAQTFLIGAATKKRQSHQRCLRNQRQVYISTGASIPTTVGKVGNVQIERIRLASRPTQRDIFWDETKGQNLDFSELLQPSPPLTDPDAGMKETTSRLKSEDGLKDHFCSDLNEKVSKSPTRTTQQDIAWLEDLRKNEQKHLKPWDTLEGPWERKLCLDAPLKQREIEKSETCRNISVQVNAVHQKWNSWDKHTS